MKNMSGQQALLSGLTLTDASAVSATLASLKKFARPTYSGFRVACISETKEGELIPGVNYEFDRHKSICAEQTALILARNTGASGLKALYLTSWPCGLCRQILSESAGLDLVIHNVAEGESKCLVELLPNAFDITYPRSFWTQDCPESIWPDESAEALLRRAFESAYAPLTRLGSAVVIETDSSTRYVGVLLENALLAAALPPLHTALVSLLSTRQDPSENSFAQIKAVYYGEISHAALSYAEANKTILSHFCPEASYKLVEY